MINYSTIKVKKKKQNLERKPLYMLSCESSILVELQFGVLVFVEGGKPRTRRKPLEQGENQQQTQPTYDTRPESNPCHISGRRALWPLRHRRRNKQTNKQTYKFSVDFYLICEVRYF